MRTKEAGISTLKNEKNNSRQKRNQISEGVALKIEENRKKIDRKIQLLKWNKLKQVIFREINLRLQNTSLYRKVYLNCSMKEEKYLGKDMCKTTSFRKPEMK